MVSTVAQTIMLSGLDWSVKRERIGAGVITPGMLLESDAANAVSPHSVGGGIQGKLFARRNLTVSGDIDSDYANGDLIRVGVGRTGDIVNLIINGGTTGLADDAEVISDGAGGIKVAVAEIGNQLIGRTLEAVADPTGALTARVKVELY